MRRPDTNTPYNSIYTVLPDESQEEEALCCKHGEPCPEASQDYAQLFPTKAEKASMSQKKGKSQQRQKSQKKEVRRKKEGRKRSRSKSMDSQKLSESLARLGTSKGQKGISRPQMKQEKSQKVFRSRKSKERVERQMKEGKSLEEALRRKRKDMVDKLRREGKLLHGMPEPNSDSETTSESRTEASKSRKTKKQKINSDEEVVDEKEMKLKSIKLMMEAQSKSQKASKGRKEASKSWKTKKERRVNRSSDEVLQRVRGSDEQVVDFDKSDTPSAEDLKSPKKQDFDVKSDKRETPPESDSRAPTSSKSSKKSKGRIIAMPPKDQKSRIEAKTPSNHPHFYLGEFGGAQAERQLGGGRAGLYHRVYPGDKDTPLFLLFRKASGKIKHFRVEKRFEGGHARFTVEEGRGQPAVFNSLTELVQHYGNGKQ